MEESAAQDSTKLPLLFELCSDPHATIVRVEIHAASYIDELAGGPDAAIQAASYMTSVTHIRGAKRRLLRQASLDVYKSEIPEDYYHGGVPATTGALPPGSPGRSHSVWPGTG